MAEVADVQQRAAGNGCGNGSRAEQEVIGREQQACQEHADREDIRAGNGEVGFEHAATHRADVAAGADDRARRPIRDSERSKRREADDRDGPTNSADDRLIDVAAAEHEIR